jgi:hypothetical protein
MADPKQPQLDPDEQDSALEEYEELRRELDGYLAKFAVDHDLSFDELAMLLIDLGVSFRMLEYVFSTEKPSGSGLKLNLDRMQREIEDYLRACKRDADDFVRDTKEAMDEAEARDADKP